MGYERTKAVDYARKFWDRPCDDGVYWFTDKEVNVEHKRKQLNAPAADGWEPRFIPYRETDGSLTEELAFIKADAAGFSIPKLAGKWQIKSVQGWAGLADCAHFLSKSLQAGGAKIFSVRVKELVAKLQALSSTITLAERVPQTNAQSIIDTGIFKPGDMIGYFNVDPSGGDYGRTNSYTHSTMFVGKLDSKGNADAKDAGRVTCHTMSRFGHSYLGDEWWLHNNYSYTLIHFTADDPLRSTDTENMLQGWWRIDVAGRKEYHLYAAGGSAQFTKYEPKSAKDPIKSPQDNGCWWEPVSKSIITIYRKTGIVVQWSVADPKNRQHDVTVDGLKGTATRLF